MQRFLKRSALPVRLPPHGRGQRIGLYGGSFNPPHAGHLMVSLMALKRLRLDAVWWLVTPGNPLKSTAELAPLAERMAAARALARHPRIKVTDLETQLGVRYTAQTIAALARRAPDARFVWIMGSDNLAGFHRWEKWRRIAAMVPMAVIDRPGTTNRALHHKAALTLERFRLPERDAATLTTRRPPAWVFLHGKRSPLSSTALRKARGVE